MDCQFIMGFFAFMYYQSFIAVYKASVGSVIETAIIGLSPEEQMEVVKGLTKYLFNQGVVSEKVNPSARHRMFVTAEHANISVGCRVSELRDTKAMIVFRVVLHRLEQTGFLFSLHNQRMYRFIGLGLLYTHPKSPLITPESSINGLDQ